MIYKDLNLFEKLFYWLAAIYCNNKINRNLATSETIIEQLYEDENQGFRDLSEKL